MTGLGMDGEVCPRCRERHLLVEFKWNTTTVFTEDGEKVTLCSLCLEEFVTGQVDRVETKVDAIGAPFTPYPEASGVSMFGGNHIYYWADSISRYPMEATLYNWVQGHT